MADPTSPDTSPPSTSSNSRIYKPISEKSIRLLTILPGTFGTTVETKLETVDLDAKPCPQYVALSYCWGDPNPPAKIICNGEVLEITPNLGNALQHLRRQPPCLMADIGVVWKTKDEGDTEIDWETDDGSSLCNDGVTIWDRTIGHRPIWIDAICINQLDIGERSQQVSFIGELYSRAERVVVWLGEDEEGSAEIAVKILKQCANLAREEAGNDRPTEKDIGVLQHSIQTREGESDHSTKRYLPGLPEPCHEDWSSVNDLVGYDRFKQAWIVQEVALSRQAIMLIGQAEILFEDLRAGCMFIIMKKDVMVRGYRMEQKTERFWPSFPRRYTRIKAIDVARRPVPLVDRILEERELEATDPRDYIYSLLGLRTYSDMFVQIGCRDPGEFYIVPDYWKPVLDLYMDVIRRLLIMPQMGGLSTGGLEVLCPRRPLDNSTELNNFHFPSWVCRLGGELQCFHYRERVDSWRVIADRKPQIRISADPRHLILCGCELATVGRTWAKIGYIPQRAIVNGKEIPIGLQTLYNEIQRKVPVLTGDPFKAVFAATVPAGTNRQTQTYGDRVRVEWISSKPASTEPTTFTGADLDLYLKGGPDVGVVYRTNDSEMAFVAHRFNDAFSLNDWEHPFTTTPDEEGWGRYLGITCDKVLEGDKICALFGGKTLYVLRPEGDYCKFIGECLIDGLMNGEVGDMIEDGLLRSWDPEQGCLREMEQWFDLR
ncbi:heterokaryon incompatibility protein-domain-containing protein [Rhexocercosporidium sp. MPI-PUGE-AT-0058]|nr:heterokaryon incompatibility protein-domain-containing protein [Rhexocercosporidium sp. MPI-PUGE-AT-0058]